MPVRFPSAALECNHGEVTAVGAAEAASVNPEGV